MKCEWNYQPLTPQQRQAAADIDAGTGVGAPIAELLVRRHVGTARQAEQFFAPALADLHDPFLMPGMDKAVHRLNKAMGAKERVILAQFVTEAATTSALGGALGIVLGYIVSMAANRVLPMFTDGMDITVSPSFDSIVVAFGISAGIGVLFGYLPAKRAAKLNPIDALRYD